MGQIVRAIQGITEACKELDYPVISGNVSLYNETDGKAIQPTPAIGGVGLLKDYEKRCDSKLKMAGDEIFVIGSVLGHLDCSIFEREILKTENKNPPKVDLKEEKKNAEFIRNAIGDSMISSCHDVSDGGLLVALFEMSSVALGCNIDVSEIKAKHDLTEEQIFFGEEQSRYVVEVNSDFAAEFRKGAEKAGVNIFRVGEVAEENIMLGDEVVAVGDLIKGNESLFVKKFN
jgi:phosphoribosylformylglycinamidine synthase subunit PurL